MYSDGYKWHLFLLLNHVLTEDARKDVPLLLTHITKVVPVSGLLSMDCLKNGVIIIIYYVQAKLYNQIKKFS